MKKYLPLAFGFLSFVVPFSIYLKTLSPTYVPIDAAEFTLCMKFWGICHPPGFPLYTMLGHFFVEIVPVGSVVYRANLFSAVFGALTVLVVYLSFIKLKVRHLFAFFPALIFAVSFTFWEFSIAADVFSFGAFLIALTYYLVFTKKYYLAVFVLGLSASHFYITAILAPIIYWYFWGLEFNKNTKSHFYRLALSAAAFVLGFFPQLVMYFRMQASPEINWGHAKNLAGFWYFIRRQEFGSIFLLSNPALTFGIDKVFLQYKEYFVSLMSTFAVVLVFVAPLGLFLKEVRNKTVLFLWGTFFVLMGVQLFLLGTIDPTGENNPFQLNKFYLSSFVIFIFLIGISVENLAKKFFDDEVIHVSFLLGLLLVILFVSNFRTLDYSKNVFSRNLILDALEQTNNGALLITLDHLIYYGTLYEQKVNGLYTDKTILYFPNDKNRDGEGYHPEIFNRQENRDFIAKVEKDYNLGSAEKYVLSTISKNLDKDIYILQGDFEYNFFKYLDGVSEPSGLWWKISNSGEINRDKLHSLLIGFRNTDFKRSDFFLKQQGFEASVYAVSYYTSALRLAELGDYAGALDYFNKSLAIDSSKTNVQNDINLVSRIRDLEQRRDELIRDKNGDLLMELALGQLTIKNYTSSAFTYEKVIELGQGGAIAYNNAASAYANLGQIEKAREYWQKALGIDPNFDLAKKGLEAIDKQK